MPGNWFSRAKKITGTLNLPELVNKKPYENILKTLCIKFIETHEKVLNEPTQYLREYTYQTKSENIVTINGKTVAKVAMTVDSTWIKRCQNSKLGVVFIISVDIAEVLNVIVKIL